MRKTILGFSQERILEFSLDFEDVYILRYIVDFIESGKMVRETFQGEEYYWVKYDAILDELPILNLKKDSLYRRLKNMVNLGLLKHMQLKRGGSYSYYTLGEKYPNLNMEKVKENNRAKDNKNDKNKDQNNMRENSPGTDKKPHTMDKTQKGSDENTEAYGNKNVISMDEKSEQKIHLIKDSTKKNKNIYSVVVGYLNERVGCNYKATTNKTKKHIDARLKDGFIEEDFITVIDNKAAVWLGTEFERFLRPETLFGEKFEGYLNERVSRRKDLVGNNTNSADKRVKASVVEDVQCAF